MARWPGTTEERGTRCSPMVQGDLVVKESVKRCATR
jgi:hypothetical protein